MFGIATFRRAHNRNSIFHFQRIKINKIDEWKIQIVCSFIIARKFTFINIIHRIHSTHKIFSSVFDTIFYATISERSGHLDHENAIIRTEMMTLILNISRVSGLFDACKLTKFATTIFFVTKKSSLWFF